MDADSFQRLSIQGADARILVAVDFGTTFSGFAYAHMDTPDSIYTLTEWDGAMEANAVAYCKTQTSLYYTQRPDGRGLEFKEWGWPAYDSFIEYCKKQSLNKKKRGGNQVDSGPEGHFVTKFKLHLAGDDNVKNSFGGLSATPLPPGLSVETAITDYLTGMTTFIIKTLQKKYGTQLTAGAIQWCLTVPAIWDDTAKQKMKVYTEKAGMVQGRYTPKGVLASPHKLIICLEPEAASFYCLNVCTDIKLRKGDQYLIADIGGGTVDIVVHEKASRDGRTGAELKVKEVLASYGGLGGGSYVDKNFYDFVNATVGCFEEYSATRPKLRTDVQMKWEQCKRSYNGELKSSFALEFPGPLCDAWKTYEQSAGMELRDDYDELELTNDDIKRIFDPVVKEIIRLISKELTGKIKAIMVVGGFSASPYLMDTIRKTFSGRVARIINPPDPGSAICHGAVLIGLAPDGGVVSRIAKKTYGIRTTRLFKQGDPAKKRIIVDGTACCTDVFIVFAKKGDELPVDHSVTHQFSPLYPGARSVSLDIYSSPLLTEPSFITDKGVHCDGNFVMDMSDALDMDTSRCIEVTLFFGRSAIEMQGRRTNFGDTQKIESFWVELEV